MKQSPKTILFSILFTLIGYFLSAQPASCYYPAVNYTAGANPFCVESSDFNNDGIKDLATSNLISNNVSILFGTGGGLYSAPTNYTVANDPWKLKSADFNADGNIDLAVVCLNKDSVSILLGSPTGIFSNPINYKAGTFPVSLVVVDFNSDTNMDIAIANQTSGDVIVLMGVGNGAFLPPVNYLAGSTPNFIISPDLNMDGFFDLVVTNLNSNDISVFLGSSNGIFSAAVNYSVGLNPRSVTSADFNNDGSADIAVGIEGSNEISVLLGSPSGTFAAIVNYPTGSHPFSITCSDFNNDGIQDLVTANYFAPNISVLFGSGTGTFSSPTSYSVGSSPAYVSASDVNGDGMVDILVANSGSANVSVLLNGIPSITFSTPNEICTGNTLTITASGADTYAWNTGANTNTIVVNPLTNTSYTVVATTTLGCSNTAVKTITVNALPSISIITSNTLICSGETATLTASGVNTYSWSSGSLVSNEIVTPTTSTDYTVTGTDINGCSNIATITQSVSLCTGIETVTANNQIEVYPNPVNAVLYIDIEIEKPDTKINIYNTLGTLVFSDALISSKNQVNIDELRNGIYIMKIIQNNRIISTGKIVRE